MGEQLDQLRPCERKIDVDRDPAPQLAVVVVEGEPGLVRDGLEHDLLALGQVDQRSGLPCAGRRRSPHRRPGLSPEARTAARASARIARRAARRRGGAPRAVHAPPRARSRASAGAEPRSSPRLRRCTRDLAGEEAGIGAQAAQLVVQPRVRLRLREQRLGIHDQSCGLGDLFGLDSRRQLRRPKYASTSPSTCRPIRSPRTR